MKPDTLRSSVDFPDPEAPMSATISPGASARVTFESALRGAPKDVDRSRMARAAPLVMAHYHGIVGFMCFNNASIRGAREQMSFTYQRQYRGKIQAVLLDWAGTTMDYGCMAPAVVFIEVYKRQNVPITMEEARAPMGAHKRVHIQKIGQLDSVRRRWEAAHGRLPTDDDVSRMFADFVPLQLACLSDYSELIPGTLEAVAAMRARGIKIGSTTGYTTEMMRNNLEAARRQGYVPASTVCASHVP